MAAPLVLPATTVPGTACPEGGKTSRVVRHACTAADAVGASDVPSAGPEARTAVVVSVAAVVDAYLAVLDADLAGVAANGAAAATERPAVVAAVTVTAAGATALAGTADADAATELGVGLAGSAEGVCSDDSGHPAAGPA